MSAREKVRIAVTVAAIGLVSLLAALPAAAADNYALVVTGASGGDTYAKKYDAWRMSLVSILRGKFHYPDDHLFVLAEREAAGIAIATRDHVRQVLGDLRKRLTKDDLLFVILIGHGTSGDGDEGKFNLVGPDLKASEWAALLKQIPGRLVFVDTTSASFAFMHHVTGPGRVVITATDSAAQEFETIFPEFFVKALDDPAADADKNGRVSVLEAFTHASAAVRQWYEQRGQLPTERSLVDDNGDGVGREAHSPGPDGAVARATFLQPLAETGPDAAVSALRKRQAEIEAQIADLKSKRPSMPPGVYDAELERLLVELARVSAQIRSKTTVDEGRGFW